jgi:ferric-dicitrate binding protein FerR (iron transport regulator)
MPADGPGVSRQRIDMGTVDPDRSLSWESRMLSFEDEPLDQVLDRFNRYARKPMVVGDANSAGLRISGTSDANDTDGPVEGLQAMFNVQVQEDDAAVKLCLQRTGPGAMRAPAANEK